MVVSVRCVVMLDRLTMDQDTLMMGMIIIVSMTSFIHPSALTFSFQRSNAFFLFRYKNGWGEVSIIHSGLRAFKSRVLGAQNQTAKTGWNEAR